LQEAVYWPPPPFQLGQEAFYYYEARPVPYEDLAHSWFATNGACPDYLVGRTCGNTTTFLYVLDAQGDNTDQEWFSHFKGPGNIPGKEFGRSGLSQLQQVRPCNPVELQRACHPLEAWCRAVYSTYKNVMSYVASIYARNHDFQSYEAGVAPTRIEWRCEWQNETDSRWLTTNTYPSTFPRLDCTSQERTANNCKNRPCSKRIVSNSVRTGYVYEVVC
jgi:hypothetical protein